MAKKVSSNTKNSKGNNKKSHVFETPLWYLQMKARVMKFGERLIWIIMMPFIPAGILAGILSIFYQNFEYSSFLTMILFFVFMIVFFLIFWKLFISKIRLDRFENFAYYSGSIGLDLDRLAVDHRLYIKPVYSINSLATYSKKVARSYPASKKKLKDTLKDFSDKLDRIFVLLKSPEDHKTELSNLSKQFLSIAQWVYNLHDVNKDILEPIIGMLDEISKPRPIEKFDSILKSCFSLFEKSNVLKAILFIIMDVAIFFIVFYGSMNYLDVSRDYAFGGAIGLSGLLLVFILRSLRK